MLDFFLNILTWVLILMGICGFIAVFWFAIWTMRGDE
jgi:uncharacterized SAM-binding protein YcdF (DUF218 family)